MALSLSHLGTQNSDSVTIVTPFRRRFLTNKLSFYILQLIFIHDYILFKKEILCHKNILYENFLLTRDVNALTLCV